jgi:hypothetical protein
VNPGLDLHTIESVVREFATRLSGYAVDTVPRSFGHSLYLRWESRGIKRSLELQIPTDRSAGVDVWANASKARRDRSLKIASIRDDAPPDVLIAALEEALAWVDRWTAPDFF